jgi:hypothetical protein
MYINNIEHKKIHQKIPPTTLVLKYVCNFSYSMTSIISSQIYFIYVEIHQSLLDFSFWLIVLSLNLIQYTSNKEK